MVVILRGDPANQPAVAAAVNTIADMAQRYPATAVQVVGHTRGRATKDAKHTAAARANDIARRLRERGVSADRIEVIDAGANRPVVHDPVPPPANSLNDRVEVVLVAPSA